MAPLRVQAEPIQITVHSGEHLEFARELCRAALAAAGMEANFSYFPPAQNKRLYAELASGNLALAFTPPDEETIALEKQGSIKAIRVPLERGLLGYRICLVRDEDADLLENVRSVDDLRKIRIGQGIGWGDITVYRNAGIGVVEAPFNSVSDPVKALASGHFDALPLGVNEYKIFLQAYNKEASGITAERHIVISYPWFRYVWVSTAAKDSNLLLEALDKGFGIIAANGEFVAIYEKYKGADPKRQQVGRRTIHLQSPYSTDEDVDPRFRHLIIRTPR
jgi:ABC-type amino acid transport substrate-binding protein